MTKSGALAGPKMVEHMVDTVLYFEGRESQGYRILRAVKNRFGSTNEIGVFEMTGLGLKEVENPSALFLSERPLDQPGSVVVPCLEGTRPILVEIQALVTPTPFSQPKRTSLGVDSGRVALLAAVLEKKLGLSLSGQDIYLNVAGGVRVTEPGADLGIALALASSLLDRAVDNKTVLLGEVGLAGEVRNVARPELRLAEAAKLGFERAIVPHRAARNGGGVRQGKRPDPHRGGVFGRRGEKGVGKRLIVSLDYSGHTPTPDKRPPPPTAPPWARPLPAPG